MTLKNIIAAVALVVVPAIGFAQSKSNEAISIEYKNKINVIKNEIKTLKAKIKAEPTNATYVVEMNVKKAELKTAQNEKKIIDKALSTAKAQRKAADKAEAKLEAAERAAEKALELRASKSELGNKSFETLSTDYKYKINVLKSEIKTLKANMKAEPGNASYIAESNAKKAALKIAQNEKKVFDKAVKTEKVRKSTAEKAEKAEKAAEKATKDAEALRKSKEKAAKADVKQNNETVQPAPVTTTEPAPVENTPAVEQSTEQNAE